MNKHSKRKKKANAKEKILHMADIDDNGVVHIKNQFGTRLAMMPLEQYANMLEHLSNEIKREDHE